MAVSPSDFRQFAESIDRSSEIGHRNAVSRLYYSFYLEVTKRIPVSGSFENTGVHQSFIEMLRNPDLGDPHATLRRKVAIVLENAKAQRVTADYKIEHELNGMTYTIVANSIDNLLPAIRTAFP